MSQNWSPVDYGVNGNRMAGCDEWPTGECDECQPVSAGNANSGQTINYEVIASAPQMELYNGYEFASFNPTIANPPQSYAQTTGDSVSPIQRQIPISANICEEEVRDALSDFVSENCCFGSKPAKHMIIRDITMNNAFHYKLETFTEKREPQWVLSHIKGQPISGGSVERPPTPWEVYVVPEVPFHRSQKTVEIPQTANVRVCHTCTGIGRIRCKDCFGCGGGNCRFCNGSGRVHDHHNGHNGHNGHHDHHDHHDHHNHHDHHDHHDHHHHNRCCHCDGTGRARCGRCDGHGQVQCQTCEGYCQLKFYIQLTVYWDNHVEDYVSCEGSTLQEGLIKQVSGSVAFDERYERVHPLTNFPISLINETSRCLIQKHSQAFPSERILEQRQSIRVIPIGLVCYTYQEKVGSFHVYGLEHKVYFPHYPSKCCCGCSIL